MFSNVLGVIYKPGGLEERGLIFKVVVCLIMF